MTSAEIIEQIKNKKAALESYRSGNPPADPAAMKALEDEIKQLQASLAGDQTGPRKTHRRNPFLDDCR